MTVITPQEAKYNAEEAYIFTCSILDKYKSMYGQAIFIPAPTHQRVKKRTGQTVPDKGWFAILRLYGPLESWFDKTWQPGIFELI